MASNFERAMAYLDKLPPAVSGAGGHDATLRAACECVRFGLSKSELWQALSWWNANRCSPKWSEKELRHKMADAQKKANPGERARPAGRQVRGRRLFSPPDMARPRFAAPRLAGSAEAPTPAERSQVPGERGERSTEGSLPVYLRSEAEEESWWAQVFAERGMVDPAPRQPAEIPSNAYDD